MATPTTPPVRVELVPYSQFCATSTYRVEAELDTGKETVVAFGLQRHPVVPDPSDTLFTVPAGGACRLDLISQKFFNTPELWWTIARCNPEIDPLAGPNVGDVIRIPARLRLATLGILSV